MAKNAGKCHYIVIGDDDPIHKIILNNNEIASSNVEKLLGILLDSKLNFDSHITSLCKKAGQKVSVLARNKSLPHSRSKVITIKLRSKISVQLLPTGLGVYLSIFKQCIKHYSRKSVTFDLQ